MGRPRHKPDPAQRRQVEALAAYGIPEPDIARVVGIDPKTLRKHYRDELDLGETKANAQVAGFLFTRRRAERLGADILAQDPGTVARDADGAAAFRIGWPARHLRDDGRGADETSLSSILPDQKLLSVVRAGAPALEALAPGR